MAVKRDYYEVLGVSRGLLILVEGLSQSPTRGVECGSYPKGRAVSGGNVVAGNHDAGEDNPISVLVPGGRHPD